MKTIMCSNVKARMAIKKQTFAYNEITIFDEAIIYKRGEYWQFRMWLNSENKYARKSLLTKSESTAIEKAKEYYLEILANLKMGKTYFSINTKEGVEKYLEYRAKDVENKIIVKQRLTTIKTHLQHWLEFIGKDTKLKELQRTDCENYFDVRHKANTKAITIKNEQSTINACIKYLFKTNETLIDSFDFKKLPKIDKKDDSVRRATFTNEEYRKLCETLRSYSAKSNNKSTDPKAFLIKQVIREYILIAANSGLRTGELKQLRWSDIEYVKSENKNSEKQLEIVKIHVRAETSKVRTSRILMCRGGEYFKRLHKTTNPNTPNSLVFSISNNTPLTPRTILYHFHKLVNLAGIKNSAERGLVPYSLRHFMITQRINSGLNYRDVADMCGTSATQIENTYWHLNDKKRYSNATADFKYNDNGTIRII